MMEYLRPLYAALGAKHPTTSLIAAILVGGFIAGIMWWAAGRNYWEHQAEKARQSSSSASRAENLPADGQGGRGGGGNAIGKGSIVMGGSGGLGGGPGGGRGGDGGGGDAVGGALVVGGDGGGGGRADGGGGRGADSPLKKLPPEVLKKWGLTGNEGYGQGGDGGNTPEYDRQLRVLTVLSVEFLSQHPEAHMVPMRGVLMPPVDWINRRLTEKNENFRVEAIDNGRDFFLHDNPRNAKAR
jgi:hypothetical protein